MKIKMTAHVVVNAGNQLGLVMAFVMMRITYVVAHGTVAIAVVRQDKQPNIPTAVIAHVLIRRLPVMVVPEAVELLHTLMTVSVMMRITTADVAGMAVIAAAVRTTMHSALIANAWMKIMFLMDVILHARSHHTKVTASVTMETTTVVVDGTVEIVVEVVETPNSTTGALHVIVSIPTMSLLAMLALSPLQEHVNSLPTLEMVTVMMEITMLVVDGTAVTAADHQVYLSNSTSAPIAHVWTALMLRLAMNVLMKRPAVAKSLHMSVMVSVMMETTMQGVIGMKVIAAAPVVSHSNTRTVTTVRARTVHMRLREIPVLMQLREFVRS